MRDGPATRSARWQKLFNDFDSHDDLLDMLKAGKDEIMESNGNRNRREKYNLDRATRKTTDSTLESLLKRRILNKRVNRQMLFWAREKGTTLEVKQADQGKTFGDGIPVVTDLSFGGIKQKMQVLSGARKRKNNTKAVKTKIKLRRKYIARAPNRRSNRREGYVLTRMIDDGAMPGFPENVAEDSGNDEAD